MRRVTPAGTSSLAANQFVFLATTQQQRLCASTASVATRKVSDTSASSWFFTHRQKTLKDLEANANDRSNAGGVDPLILPTVQLINSYAHYCTASSCSGRVSVFHRAIPSTKQKQAAPSVDGNNNRSIVGEGGIAGPKDDVAIANKKRGNGLGTVFSSHDPVGDTLGAATQIYDALVMAKVPIVIPSADKNNGALAELLQLKFEPTILHTTCATMSDAHRFIAASSESGHRSTGIVVSKAGREMRNDDGALLTDEDLALQRIGEGWKITAKMQSMVCFDAPLYTSTSGWLLHGGHAPLPSRCSTPTGGECKVAEEWIAMLDRLLRHANSLFAENVARRDRFMVALQEMEKVSESKKRKKV